jgi:hypothetical protein
MARPQERRDRENGATARMARPQEWRDCKNRVNGPAAQPLARLLRFRSADWVRMDLEARTTNA